MLTQTDNLKEKFQWEISQEYSSKQKSGRIRTRCLSLKELSQRQRRKLRKELRLRRPMLSKSEFFRKLLMMKRSCVSLLSNKKLMMKNLKGNYLLIKLRKLKKTCPIVKTGFKDSSKT